ncbi:MAG: molybdopterin-dependent oxidoreductase [Deltaproteobacteria bacterium]|jgi:DMSO/TMAO reductase YedYZ molybdopterin-dependent catalytic subunit|nr:molybdopterin-dependent oxidoreductase [Deltaproteobacteria bacterium]MBK8238908.1 molybdopterin-dependent oxidoreductase [Deltaproteobacteria bacterium]MBK8715782.1 molybdopterin-dependent oxidoreductase [Deltaproteobacteria bacterium]MBP7288139.1 molybdopterin-dependent oxidoreductase [Nannocystaceae bacterium]
MHDDPDELSNREHTRERGLARRDFLLKAAAGTIVTGLAGGLYVVATPKAHADNRPDGRPRVPPGQRVIEALKPMGGEPGESAVSKYRLRVHGEVESPFELDFAALVAFGAVERTVDVHCVTGWTVLGARFKGVRIKDLAKKAGVKDSVRHVIFEGAHGYTANVRWAEATGDDALVTWELDGKRLARPHGAPVRALVPDLYFWKSAKWLEGIRFVKRDEPGFWETRGYHNHADPWTEERYG